MQIKSYKKNGKTYYMFQIRLGDKVTTRRGFETKLEASKEYNKLKEKGVLRENKTFDYVFNNWIEVYKTTVKGSTVNKIYEIYNNHIKNVFGDIYVDKITQIDAQNYINSLTQYVRGKEIYNRAKRIMKHAVMLDLVDKNVFEYVVVPKFKCSNKQKHFLEKNDVIKILEHLKNDLEWYCLFRLIIFTGLRRGELLALTWDDIDFKNLTLNIDKTLSRDDLGHVVVTKPKTSSSIGVLDLDKETITYLKKYKLQKSINGNIIFSNSKNDYKRFSDIQDKLNKITEELNISKTRVHDLRHTTASLLYDMGFGITEIKERLRHGNSKTTLDIYTHLTKSKKNEVADKFAEFISEKKVL